jgi:hypothetical protein
VVFGQQTVIQFKKKKHFRPLSLLLGSFILTETFLDFIHERWETMLEAC